MPDATPDFSFSTACKEAVCIEGTPRPEPIPLKNKMLAATTSDSLDGSKKYKHNANAEQQNDSPIVFVRPSF